MSEIDDIDLYLEKIDSKNPENVIYQGKSVPLDRFKERIIVKRRQAIEIETMWGPHGHIVADTKYDTKKEKKVPPID